MGSQVGNVEIKDSMITRFMETNAEEMGDIRQVRRWRIYQEMTDEDEEEEGSISLGCVLTLKTLNLSVFPSWH